MRRPSASSSTSVRKRRFHRIGIRVVAVVDELNAVDLLDLEPRFRERSGGEAGRAFFQRKAEGAAGRDRQHRVLHHVNPGHRQLRAAAMRAFQNRELAIRSALWLHLGRADGAILDSGQNDFGAGALGDAFAEWIVRIQNHRAIGADRFRQRAFFQRDRFAAAHEFDMREADVRDDRDIRRGEFRQRGDLARMIHPDFPDGDLVARDLPPASFAEDPRDC